MDGITHYVVDHTLLLFWKTTSASLSEEFIKYVDFFKEERPLDSEVLSKAHNFETGEILDDRIKTYQNR